MATRFCVFDVETQGKEARFSSGAWCSPTERDWSTDPAVLLEALRRAARQRLTLAAHNAEYDLVTFLWRQGEDVTLHYYEGTFVHAAWKFNGSTRTAPIWDSMRLSGGLSIEDLGEAIGLPKLPMPQKLKGRDPDQYRWQCEDHSAWECERCYTLRDVDIAYRHLENIAGYVEAQGVALKRTLPSTAMALWAALDQDQGQALRSPQLRALARAAQHGGRCEVFHYGNVGQTFTYDVRRHYGYLLATQGMPDLQTLQWSADLPLDFDLQGKEGVIEATVAQEPRWCPTLPVAREGALCYPVGAFRDTWAILELRRAIERGARLLRIHQAAWSERAVFPFLNTAGALLKASCDWEDAKNPLYLVAKQLLNAIPGRLGMQEGGEQRVYRRWVPGMSRVETLGWEPTLTSDAVYLHRSTVMQHPPSTANLLWAVQITALGRTRLLELLDLAGKSLRYCDTDSLHTAQPLPVGDGSPGQLRDTGAFDQGRYLAPKLYRLESWSGQQLVRAKGVPRHSAAAFFATGQVRFEAFVGVQQALASSQNPGAWVDVERVRHLGLSRRQLDDPSALDREDGSSGTQPLVFGPD